MSVEEIFRYKFILKNEIKVVGLFTQLSVLVLLLAESLLESLTAENDIASICFVELITD